MFEKPQNRKVGCFQPNPAESGTKASLTKTNVPPTCEGPCLSCVKMTAAFFVFQEFGELGCLQTLEPGDHRDGHRVPEALRVKNPPGLSHFRWTTTVRAGFPAALRSAAPC